MFGVGFFRRREAAFVWDSFKKNLTKHPLEFEDGKWVAPAKGIEMPDLASLPFCFFQRGFYIVGKREGITAIGLPKESDKSFQLSALISDNPFLVVYVEAWKTKLPTGEIACSELVGGFNAARQIKNGDLGRMPRITKSHPRYVRMESGRWGWANLKELCDIVGMDAKTLLENYLAVADQRLLKVEDKTDYVELPPGMTEEEIPGFQRGIREFTRVWLLYPKLGYGRPITVDSNLYTYFPYWREGILSHRPFPDFMKRELEYRHNPADIFIPAGLAINILLLNEFGYQPRKI